MIPYHVAIIMDGNRRWALNQSLESIVGHWAGAQALTQIVQAASDIGIKVLTVFAFSTENWMRSQTEINSLFDLLEIYLLEQRKEMIKNGVKLETIGQLNRFPKRLLDVIEESKKATAEGEKIELVLALNYGGRDELKRAVLSIAEDYASQKLSKEHITEEIISTYLDTAKWKDPDLLIRTSGEMRVSNFLLWQLSYTEIYVTDTLWPEFSAEHLHEAISNYQQRQRRIGA